MFFSVRSPKWNCVFSGTTVFAEIQGVIEACVRLTGMPDLTLSFMVGSTCLSSAVFCMCIVSQLVYLFESKIQSQLSMLITESASPRRREFPPVCAV